MQCPYCECNDTKVTDSRDATEINATRRRRECSNCKKRFTTFETVELAVQVRKKNGICEDFCEQKLIRGLSHACHHTTISHDQILNLAAQIKDALFREQQTVIPTRVVGEKVMEMLKSLDPIAYIRFACVYRRFKDIGELMEAIETIQPQESKIDMIPMEVPNHDA